MIRVTRTALELFGWSIHWYGAIIALGIALGVMLACAREKRLGLPKDATLDLALCCVPAALVGARIYYVVFKWSDYAAGPWWKVFAVWEGGMAIYGGILAGALAGAIFARVKKLSFRRLADLAAPSIALGQAVGRWGNFINQEAHGRLVTNPSLQFFPAAVRIDGEWFYATFFYESAWCLLIAAALLLLERRRSVRPGGLFLNYVFLYGLERGVVEGLRTDSLMWGAMRVSQGLSVLAALAVTVVWLAEHRQAPVMLRLGTAVCALIALVCAALGAQWGILAAGAGALVFAARQYKYVGKICEKDNRGEAL